MNQFEKTFYKKINFDNNISKRYLIFWGASI